MDLYALVYVGGFTLLFFFWAYGIVSFGRDLKRTIIPGIRGLLADGEDEPDTRAEPDYETLEQLYESDDVGDR